MKIEDNGRGTEHTRLRCSSVQLPDLGCSLFVRYSAEAGQLLFGSAAARVFRAGFGHLPPFVSLHYTTGAKWQRNYEKLLERQEKYDMELSLWGFSRRFFF